MLGFDSLRDGDLKASARFAASVAGSSGLCALRVQVGVDCSGKLGGLVVEAAGVEEGDGVGGGLDSESGGFEGGDGGGEAIARWRDVAEMKGDDEETKSNSETGGYRGEEEEGLKQLRHGGCGTE